MNTAGENTALDTTTPYGAYARFGGILYLTIIVAGIFAQMFVRASLTVAGDATATAANIAASASLFRMGIAADIIMIASDIAIALIFYVLLKPVSNGLSLLAAFFRLAQAMILAVNLMNLTRVLQFLDGAGYLSVIGADQRHAQALLSLEAHGLGYSLGLVFFGLSCLILGYLIARSGYLPRILGILLVVAGAGYLVDSFANLLLPNYSDYEMIFGIVVFAPAIVAELALALWLLVKSVNVERAPLLQGSAA